MGAFKYTITIEADAPPKITLGENIGGGIVKEMKVLDAELLSSEQLAAKYNISSQTVRRKLAAHNQGLQGKHLYNVVIADGILNPKVKKSTGGARRKN
ncbi:DNA-binding protein [Acinetobacter sp.]|uniref:DNA-binding protein n=1 Tax=Acinetobacter sp. TaxID=472 RepID=UPI0035B0F3F7